MSTLHLCNSFFEWELAGELPPSLEKAFSLNPFFSQLQFLPLLYANSREGILVTEKPTPLPSHPLCLVREELPLYDRLETWGHSLLAKKWAEERNVTYEIPDWDLVKMVNSKAYSFAKSPLPSAQLLQKGDPLPKGYVLKSCFGTAGRGHVFSDHPKALAFCEREWQKNLPVIGEPWVERQLDFSTQWEITQRGEIHYLGATLCKTSFKGTHQSNSVGSKITPILSPGLENQKEKAEEVLIEMQALGFFGTVGFDAMVYNENQLQPIVEINARKTMGWLALAFQTKHYPTTSIELSYIKTQGPGLLPPSLGPLNFSKQLYTRTL